MKIPLLIYVPVILFFIAACGGEKNKKTSQSDNDSVAIKPECYIAVFQKDTAYLNIKRLESAKIEGNLLIQYWNNPKNEGKIAGRINGDTLFADYTYTVGTYKEMIKNPLAFLLKNDSLILGVGEIETKMGRSYFKPGVPISFDRGRFRFIKTECSD
ncbi:hypothetical protein WG906_00975 [Pedobacter sp. P351]|uniref:hypothetical protein n=1 Tax=Pedobacter superstes TaxID=3133441 RepID=UPI0030A66DEC